MTDSNEKNTHPWTPDYAWYKKVYTSIPEDELIELYESQSGKKSER